MYNAANFSHPPDFLNPSFKVTAGPDPVHLELKLAPGGKVSGHVTDAEGRPVPKADIQIQETAGMGFMGIRADEKGSISRDRTSNDRSRLIATNQARLRQRRVLRQLGSRGRG